MNIRRYKTLKRSTKLVLWMSRKQQNKKDQSETLLSVYVLKQAVTQGFHMASICLRYRQYNK